MVSGKKEGGGGEKNNFVLKDWHLYKKQSLFLVQSCCDLFLQVMSLTILASDQSQ